MKLFQAIVLLLGTAAMMLYFIAGIDSDQVRRWVDPSSDTTPPPATASSSPTAATAPPPAPPVVEDDVDDVAAMVKSTDRTVLDRMVDSQTESSAVEEPAGEQDRIQTDSPFLRRIRAESSWPTDRAELEQRIVAASVRVGQWTGQPGEPYWAGGGVIIDVSTDHLDVLTADHVLGPGGPGVVQIPTGPAAGDWATLGAVTLVARDASKDLALLRVQTPAAVDATAAAVTTQPGDHTSFRVSDDSTGATSWVSGRGWIGQPVWTIDSIGPERPEIALARIDSIQSARPRPTEAVNTYFRLATASLSGMSGSGLFNADGGVVGIASGNSAGQAHYVAASVLAEFLASVR